MTEKTDPETGRNRSPKELINEPECKENPRKIVWYFFGKKLKHFTEENQNLFQSN
ncbi:MULTISPECIES: hypothetical protein [unclassified Methanosarcina]|uniref:hypothetical protein n=1 Tax=unclassified Methanosarcina TaxID=2644672 RepID=UPI0012E01670|nr:MULTISPECIES: hypothetical protein [unclassified Methanosarcina]